MSGYKGLDPNDFNREKVSSNEVTYMIKTSEILYEYMRLYDYLNTKISSKVEKNTSVGKSLTIKPSGVYIYNKNKKALIGDILSSKDIIVSCLNTEGSSLDGALEVAKDKLEEDLEIVELGPYKEHKKTIEEITSKDDLISDFRENEEISEFDIIRIKKDLEKTNEIVLP